MKKVPELNFSHNSPIQQIIWFIRIIYQRMIVTSKNKMKITQVTEDNNYCNHYIHLVAIWYKTMTKIIYMYTRAYLMYEMLSYNEQIIENKFFD